MNTENTERRCPVSAKHTPTQAEVTSASLATCGELTADWATEQAAKLAKGGANDRRLQNVVIAGQWITNNAALLVAAPDLLAACEESVTEPGALAYRSHAYAIKRLEAINAAVQSAILKAKGQGAASVPAEAKAPAVTRDELAARLRDLVSMFERGYVHGVTHGTGEAFIDGIDAARTVLSRLSAEGGAK